MKLKFTVFLFLTLVAVTSCNSGFSRKKSIGPESFNSYPAFKKLVKRFDDKYSPSDRNFNDFIDSVRIFVHEGSSHAKSQQELSLCDTKKCLEEYADKMNSFIVNGDAPPKVICSHRSFLARQILAYYNIESRRVNLVNGKVRGHVFLEAKNPFNDQWVAFDPDYNIFYRNPTLLTRYGIEEIISRDFSDFVPCSEKGCSWDSVHSKDGYSPQVLRGNHYYGLAFVKGVVAYYNEAKFFPKKDKNWVINHVGTSNVFEF